MALTLSPKEIRTYGLTPFPQRMATYLANIDKSNTVPVSAADIPLPLCELAQQVQAYAERELPAATYAHSMRVFLYASTIIQQHIPLLGPLRETLFLATLLHDLGTAPQHQLTTALSFEFRGGYLALSLLADTLGALRAQAESVAEAIIRHQDLGESGNVSALGAVVQVATVFDNLGMNAELVHPDTIASVVAAWPRKGWSGCFAETVRREVSAKPWCHTTAIHGFAEQVEANTLMAEYE